MNTIKSYKRMVNYYETDKMGITHHANYIHWMEEARIDWLKQIGWDYVKLEESGISSPVTGLDCKYLASTQFADIIEVQVSIAQFKGVRITIKYEMKKEDGTTVFVGHSEHCFVNKEGKLIMHLKKDYPGFYEALEQRSPKI